MRCLLIAGMYISDVSLMHANESDNIGRHRTPFVLLHSMQSQIPMNCRVCALVCPERPTLEYSATGLW